MTKPERCVFSRYFRGILALPFGIVSEVLCALHKVFDTITNEIVG